MDNLVQVMVPRRHLTRVYELIARLEAQVDGNGDSATGKESPGQEAGTWTPELVRRMYEESPPGMLRALNYLADNPDQWVHAPDLTEAIEPGRDSHRLGGTLGAFGRRVKNRYQMDSWPFKMVWDHEAGHAKYVMDGDTAEQLQSYRRAS